MLCSRVMVCVCVVCLLLLAGLGQGDCVGGMVLDQGDGAGSAMVLGAVGVQVQSVGVLGVGGSVVAGAGMAG